MKYVVTLIVCTVLFIAARHATHIMEDITIDGAMMLGWYAGGFCGSLGVFLLTLMEK